MLAPPSQGNPRSATDESERVATVLLQKELI